MGIQLPVQLMMDRGRAAARCTPPGSASHESGMVTLEIALAIPLVLIFAVAGAWLVAAGQAQALVTDAARATAREVARGVPERQAVAAGHQVAPDAEIVVSASGSVIRVRAERTLRGPGPLLSHLRQSVSSTVVTTAEESNPFTRYSATADSAPGPVPVPVPGSGSGPGSGPGSDLGRPR